MKLYLDHFYRVIPATQFERVLKLVDLIPGTIHRKNSSESAFWEGIYFHSGSGEYFEILREEPMWKAGTGGFAFSQHGEEEDVRATLTSEFPQFKWKFHEYKKPTGESWYKCTEFEEIDYRLYAWSMHYQGEFRQKRALMGRDLNPCIQSFDSIELTLESEVYSRAEAVLEWAVQSTAIQDGKKVIQLPKRGAALLECVLKEAATPNWRFNISFTLKSEVPLQLNGIDGISANQNGTRVEISFG